MRSAFILPRQQPTIESSESKDTRIYYGLSFLGNTEPPRNLQQTKAQRLFSLSNHRIWHHHRRHHQASLTMIWTMMTSNLGNVFEDTQQSSTSSSASITTKHPTTRSSHCNNCSTSYSCNSSASEIGSSPYRSDSGRRRLGS